MDLATAIAWEATGAVVGILAGLLANRIGDRLEGAANDVRRAAGLPLVRCARINRAIPLCGWGLLMGLDAIALGWRFTVGPILLMALGQAIPVAALAIPGGWELRQARRDARAERENPRSRGTPDVLSVSTSEARSARRPSPPPARR